MSHWSRILIILGVIIACVNMSLAWVIMFRPPEIVPSGQIERTLPAESKQQPAADDFVSMIELIARMSAPGSARTYHVTVLVLAFSFALLAIGFSLFVMGVEGALHVSGSSTEIGSVAVKMTSPGLACILTAAAIIGLTLFFGSDFETAEKARARGVEAEAKAKETLLRAEAAAKETLLRAEADAKRDEGYAKGREADAKIRLMEAEARIKEEEALRLQTSRPILQ